MKLHLKPSAVGLLNTLRKWIGYRPIRSEAYWEHRYVAGGTSGCGSYGQLAEMKAKVINSFVAEHNVQSVIEFGCGDGNQLTLAHYPSYLGFDVSKTAVAKCQALFATDTTKAFHTVDQYQGQQADLTLSLDVIYHLLEDQIFEAYMRRLFSASRRYVIIYSSDSDENSGSASHVRHRKFTDWVNREHLNWRLLTHLPNPYPYKGDDASGSFAEFFIYELRDTSRA